MCIARGGACCQVLWFHHGLRGTLNLFTSLGTSTCDLLKLSLILSELTLIVFKGFSCLSVVESKLATQSRDPGGKGGPRIYYF